MAEAPSTLADVLTALRRQDDEVQLTRTLAAFADPEFAPQLAKAFLRCGSEPSAHAQAERVPEDLECNSEVHLGPLFGRADLLFRGTTEPFNLIVEAKLGAGYGHDQLLNYCQSLRERPENSSGVLAIRRSSEPDPEETKVGTNPYWRGALRWAEVYPHLLALDHPDPLLNETWHVFLQALADEGEFGLVTLDRTAIEGWGKMLAGRRQLRSLLAELTEPALEIIRDELPATFGADPQDRAALIQGRREWEDHIFQAIAVPAGAPVERLWLQFVGGEPGVRFTLDARTTDGEARPDPSNDELRQATSLLSDWETGEYYGRYWSRPHLIDTWLRASPPETVEVLMAFVREDIRSIVRSGLLERLPLPPESERIA